MSVLATVRVHYGMLLLLCCCLFVPFLQAQPAIGRNGILQAASQRPLALVGNEIGRGQLLVVTGVRLESPGQTTRIRLSSQWGSKDLPLLSSSSTRLEARIPVDVPPGPSSLVVISGGEVGAAIPVVVTGSHFGIFSRNGRGYGPGRIDNQSAGGARTENAMNGPAAPGQTFVIAGTGLGDASAPKVMVGGKVATVVGIRKAKAGAQVDEIAAKVPVDAPEGCFVPVQVRNAGRIASNIVTMAIRRGSGPCVVDAAIPFAGWAGTRFGLVAVAGAGADGSIVDEAGAAFGRLPEVNRMALLFLAPPPGLCLNRLEAVGASVPTGNPFVELLTGAAGSDYQSAGGSLAIDDGATLQKIRPVEGASGIYHSKFAASGRRGGAGALPHFLSPGELHIAAAGGSAGTFRVTLPGPQPFDAMGQEEEIDRTRGAVVRWAPLDSVHFALVVLTYADPATFTTGSCYCVAPPGSTELRIPAEALAGFPANVPAALTVAGWPVRPVLFSATGLEHGLAVSTFLRTQRVTLR